jgi:hypothetical protein
MNRVLEQRNKLLERQLALYASSRPAVDVVQNVSPLGLRIPNRGSTASYSGPSSPASTQSDPVFLKTEEQDDIDQIIAPTRHLHVRDSLLFSHVGQSDHFRVVFSSVIMNSNYTAPLLSLG